MNVMTPDTEALAPTRFPCSASQERCWFLDRMAPGTPALNVAVRWSVKGRFTAAAFEAAFRDVIARHEILRTAFAEEGGRPVQQVADRVDFHLAEIDLRAVAPADQPARIEEIAAEAAVLPFDLTQPGLIRATMIRLAEDDALLAITIHQSCFDGWSIGVLGREVGTRAAAHMGGGGPAMEELPLQYGDYALWQRAYFDSDAFAADVAPLRDRLADAPYFELPPDKPRPAARGAACDMVMTDLPPVFGKRLKAAAQAQGLSPFAFGAGVLSAALGRSTDADEVVMGTQVAGRTEVDLEPLIGVFINNVVMRFPTPDDATLADHLARARTVVQEALMAQNVPFNKLVEVLNPPRDPARTPLISVNFILQNVFLEAARYGDFELASAPSHAPGTIYDLNFILIGRPTGWRMTLEYSADLFTQETAQALLEIWQAAFAFAFDTPQGRLADMPHLPTRAPEAATAPVPSEVPTEASDVEDAVARIWCDILGLPRVAPADNFFDLGGHSLLTVRMLTRIEAEFGQRLSLADVYHAPTLRALAWRLTRQVETGEAAPAPGDWRVLPLQTEGAGLPIIAINNAQTVFALSNTFIDLRPATAVRIYDASRDEPLPARSFDEIASAYVEAVRAAQPEGPYALFGVCVHGNIAVEVARQLQAEGEEVAAVILKDVWEPRYAVRIGTSRWASFLDRVHAWRNRLRFLRRGDISLAAFLGSVGPLRRSGLLGLAIRLGLMDRVRHTDLDAEQEGFINYLSRARDAHRPDPYEGTVLHFVTGDAPQGRAFDPTMGWADLVRGDLRIVNLPELSIAQGRNIGVAEAAREIERLLNEMEGRYAKSR
ncbi:condensation domain-containing protein [Jannaschia marina]|uniref:condensation domain-containing protein n=1 Tax=Jannaschia marina TaxID=2741674 RepID=UPI0015C98B7E|nr:condensation domain-containing protein [Jannaschia marina]